MKIMYYKQDKINKIRKYKLALSQWFFDGFGSRFKNRFELLTDSLDFEKTYSSL